MSAKLSHPPTGAAASGSASTAADKLAERPDSVLVERARLGDEEALDCLFRRHLDSFRRHARFLCNSPADAEDICQNACLHAIAHLGELRLTDAFCSWVLGFVAGEAGHWRRKLKKVGTLGPEVGTYVLEGMSVETASCGRGCVEDLPGLLHVLEQRSAQLEAACRRIAAVLLRHYEDYEELPSIRTLARAAPTSRSSADRRYRVVMQAWRRTLAASGFWPGAPVPSKHAPPPDSSAPSLL